MEKPAAIQAGRPTLAIHLLGPFRIAVNGAPVEERQWTRRKSKTLVKLLALQPHRQLHREQVMELLWPELDLDAAVNNLHKTIHAARRALEPELKAGAESGFIVTQDQQVILRAPGELWIDFQVFEQRAMAALKDHDAAACESALELYAGDLLSDDLYEDWAVSRREQLRLLRQKLLRRLAQIHETNGHHQQAIESYQRLVEASPSDEESHRHLMRLYAHTGDRGQAMRQYQQCRESLRRELDAEPEPATVELHERIAAGRVQAMAQTAANDSSPALRAAVMKPRANPHSLRRFRNPGLIAAGILLIAAIGAAIYWRATGDKTVDSLVVLPFVNESGDESIEYLSDGITESVINNLSHLPSLRVMARTTAFRYKGRASDPQAVGRDLKVEAALTGKVERRGEYLIIQADLVSVSDGAQLWGAQYSRRPADIYTVQEEISREITEKLRLRLTSEAEQRMAKHPTTSSDAYQHYLKGRYHWNRRTTADFRKSIEYFQQAINADPGYALAHAGLADAYASLSNTQLPPNEAMPLAEAAALKALALDDRLAEARTSLAAVKWRYRWDHAGAEAEFKRALDLNPNYATARQWYGLFLIYRKQFEAGRAEMLKAQHLDPLSLAINAGVGLSYYFARQYDPAIERLRRTIEMDPNFPYTHFFLGWALEQKGQFAPAVAAFQRAAQIDATPSARAYLAHGYAMQGNRQAAERILAELQEQSARSYVSPYYSAVICAGLGESRRALEYLQRAIDDRSDSMALLNVEPKFDGLRANPQFIEILRRTGLNP